MTIKDQDKVKISYSESSLISLELVKLATNYICAIFLNAHKLYHITDSKFIALAILFILCKLRHAKKVKYTHFLYILRFISNLLCFKCAICPFHFPHAPFHFRFAPLQMTFHISCLLRCIPRFRRTGRSLLASNV